MCTGRGWQGRFYDSGGTLWGTLISTIVGETLSRSYLATLFKNQFSTSLSHDCIHFDSVFDEIGLPKIVKSKILKLDLDVQFREEHSPVTGFHGIALEFLEDIVDFFVFLDKCFVLIVDIMRSESIWELVHLFQKTVQLILYLFVNVGRKWDLVDVFNWFPNLIYCGPNAFE